MQLVVLTHLTLIQSLYISLWYLHVTHCSWRRIRTVWSRARRERLGDAAAAVRPAGTLWSPICWIHVTERFGWFVNWMAMGVSSRWSVWRRQPRMSAAAVTVTVWSPRLLLVWLNCIERRLLADQLTNNDWLNAIMINPVLNVSLGFRSWLQSHLQSFWFIFWWMKPSNLNHILEYLSTTCSANFGCERGRCCRMP